MNERTNIYTQAHTTETQTHKVLTGRFVKVVYLATHTFIDTVEPALNDYRWQRIECSLNPGLASLSYAWRLSNDGTKFLYAQWLNNYRVAPEFHPRLKGLRESRLAVLGVYLYICSRD